MQISTTKLVDCARRRIFAAANGSVSYRSVRLIRRLFGALADVLVNIDIVDEKFDIVATALANPDSTFAATVRSQSLSFHLNNVELIPSSSLHIRSRFRQR